MDELMDVHVVLVILSKLAISTKGHSDSKALNTDTIRLGLFANTGQCHHLNSIVFLL